MKHARPDYQNLTELDKKIPADEPVFLLRAQDKTAAMVVRIWAAVNRVDSPDLAKLAEEHAARMDAWPKKKTADLVVCQVCPTLRGKIGDVLNCPNCKKEWTVVEVCAGCGTETAKRDCGCPCGTALSNREVL